MRARMRKDKGERILWEQMLWQFRKKRKRKKTLLLKSVPCVSHLSDVSSHNVTAWFYHVLMTELKKILCIYTQDKVVGSAGAAPVWVSALLSQRLTLCLISVSLCLKDKEDGVRDEGQMRRCVCSDAWVAISASSAPTSPEGHGGGCAVGRVLWETTARRRAQSVRGRAASNWSSCLIRKKNSHGWVKLVIYVIHLCFALMKGDGNYRNAFIAKVLFAGLNFSLI